MEHPRSSLNCLSDHRLTLLEGDLELGRAYLETKVRRKYSVKPLNVLQRTSATNHKKITSNVFQEKVFVLCFFHSRKEFFKRAKGLLLRLQRHKTMYDLTPNCSNRLVFIIANLLRHNVHTLHILDNDFSKSSRNIIRKNLRKQQGSVKIITRPLLVFNISEEDRKRNSSALRNNSNTMHLKEFRHHMDKEVGKDTPISSSSSAVQLHNQKKLFSKNFRRKRNGLSTIRKGEYNTE